MKLSQREKRLLGLLGLLAAAFAVRALFTLARPSGGGGGGETAAASARPASTSSRFGRGSRQRVAQIPDEVAQLRLEDLVIAPRDFTVGRDPFRYGPPPPPPPPPGPSAEDLERMRREAEEARRRAEAAARAAAIPRPPPITVVYLGSFGPSARKVAVFSGEDGEKLYNALVGDVLEGKFIVDRIGFESVDLKFVGFPDEPAKRLAIGG